MSEPTEATPSAPAPVAADNATTTATKADDKSPAWLPERIEQAKRSAMAETLKALGVADVESAKAAIAKARELEEASKTEIQRLSEKALALEPLAKRAAELDATVARYADAELAMLSEAQRAAVAAIAGDDKARALATIDALRPTWVAAAAAPLAASAPIPAPANTSQVPAPKAAMATAGVDHKATYEGMRATNPVMAAQYLSAHSREIFPS
jgi:NAD-dependent DNA ligase